MNAARDQILSDYGFGGRTMTRIDYDELCDRAEDAEISRRESVPVSYTHLDVYKRQLYEKPGAGTAPEYF